MKKTMTFNATIEGLTIHDIIEILALQDKELPKSIAILLR